MTDDDDETSEEYKQVMYDLYFRKEGKQMLEILARIERDRKRSNRLAACVLIAAIIVIVRFLVFLTWKV